jgi:excisionase family DNA binding protein
MKSLKRKGPRGSVLRTRSEADELTIAEAARLLHLSRTYLDALISAGKFPGIRKTRGGRRRIPRADVLAFKAQARLTQMKGLARMIEASQRMGLYEREISQLGPRRNE